MFEEITEISDFKSLTENCPAVFAYFSVDDCQVCKALKPKVENLIVSNFPQIRGVYINLNNAPELAARYVVFTAPTMVIFLENKELFRKIRAVGIHELKSRIDRPYQLLFK